MEWLYHIGVPEDQIEELAENSANTVPVMMPYIDAFFMPRAKGDRPDIVPKGAVNSRSSASSPRRRAIPSSPRVFHAHRHGGGLHPAERGSRRCRRFGAAPMTCATGLTPPCSSATVRRSPTWSFRSSRRSRSRSAQEDSGHGHRSSSRNTMPFNARIALARAYPRLFAWEVTLGRCPEAPEGTEFLHLILGF